MKKFDSCEALTVDLVADSHAWLSAYGLTCLAAGRPPRYDLCFVLDKQLAKKQGL